MRKSMQRSKFNSMSRYSDGKVVALRHSDGKVVALRYSPGEVVALRHSHDKVVALRHSDSKVVALRYGDKFTNWDLVNRSIKRVLFKCLLCIKQFPPTSKPSTDGL